MPSCAWSSDVCSSDRSEEHTSELQSQSNLVCRLLLEKKKTAELHSPPNLVFGHLLDNEPKPCPGPYRSEATSSRADPACARRVAHVDTLAPHLCSWLH